MAVLRTRAYPLKSPVASSLLSALNATARTDMSMPCTVVTRSS
jgi:hypothetical protein